MNPYDDRVQAGDIKRKWLVGTVKLWESHDSSEGDTASQLQQIMAMQECVPGLRSFPNKLKIVIFVSKLIILNIGN